MECCQGYALIPLDEELPFGQAMRQGRGLEGEVGLLIVGEARWPGQRRLQAEDVTELVAGLGIGAAEDFRVQTDDVLRLEVYGLLSRIGQV